MNWQTDFAFAAGWVGSSWSMWMQGHVEAGQILTAAVSATVVAFMFAGLRATWRRLRA